MTVNTDCQVLVDKHPEYVVKRYESGGFATNAACDGIYRQALDRLSKGSGRSAPTSYSYRPDGMSTGSIFPAQSSMTQLGRAAVSEDGRSFIAGGKGNPVHVIVDEGICYKPLIHVLNQRTLLGPAQVGPICPHIRSRYILHLLPDIDYG